MAEPRTSRPAGGFSMVEMLVALVFTMLLMAGMATVFRASLNTFVTSGEVLSSARRNQMSIDLLGDDLNNACMYILDLVNPPATSTGNPPFCVLPNMPLAGAPTTPAATDPVSADELYFFVDQPLPFQGTLTAVPATGSANQMVVAGTAPVNADYTYSIDCVNTSYANQVLANYNQQNPPSISLIFKDSWQVGLVTALPVVNGSVVTIVLAASSSSGITGIGPGTPLGASHSAGAGVVFLQPSQVVKYSVQWLPLDPQNVKGIPCLVRDQGLYSAQNNNYASPFVTNQPQQIISENVQGFKAYLSVNSGAGWAGYASPAKTYTGFANGWTAGVWSELATQMTTEDASAPAMTSDPTWFRDYPTLVRVDVTTRTATSRTDYSPNPTGSNASAAFNLLTQSLVFVPRHSGLPMN